MDLSIIGPAVAAAFVGLYLGVVIGMNVPDGGDEKPPPPEPEPRAVPGNPVLIILGDPNLVPVFREHLPEAQIVSVADPGWHTAKLGLNDVLVLYRQ